MRKIKSLRHQLLLGLVVPLLLFVTIDTVLSYFVTLHYVHGAYDRWLIDSAKSLTQEIAVRDGKPFVELPLAAWEILEWDETDRIHFKIVSDREGLLAGDANVPELARKPADPSEPVLFEAELYGETIRVALIRTGHGDPSGRIDIYFAETMNKRRSMMRDLLLADLIPQIVMIVLTGIYLLAGIRRGLMPLHFLANEIAQRSPKDLSPIPDTHIFVEVRTLTDKINDLLRQLDHAIATQDRFIGNAAHQLRTPLAGLKLQAERVLRERDLNTTRPVLAQILGCADRMSHLIAQLLLLAKSEPIQGMREPKPLDLSQLARDVCIEWVPRARRRDMELSFDSPMESLPILGDETLLRELLANLLDNAVKYGTEHGRIRVALISHPRTGMIVEDDGPGIPEQEIGRVFERFYRPRNSPGTGSGLGLSIVKEIADLHHAQIRLGSRSEQSGTRIEVLFPECSVASSDLVV